MTKHDLSDLERHWNCRLTTLGRSSGEPREVTIWFALGPDTLYLTGSASNPHWCRNVRANGAVEVRIGSRTLSGSARLVDDPAEAERIRGRFIDRYLLARLSRPFGGYTDSIAVEVKLD